MPTHDTKLPGIAEHRRAPRIQVNLPVTIAAYDSKPLGEGRITDISETGLAFILQQALAVGSKISVKYQNCVLEAEVRHSRPRAFSSRVEYLTGVEITEVIRGSALWRQLLDGLGDQQPRDEETTDITKADLGSPSPTTTATDERILQALEHLPAFPPVVRYVLASLSGDEDSISLPAVGNLIARDSLLAGKILGVANSSLYNRGQEINSVRQAVARLGIDRLRNVVLGLSANRIWGGLHAPAAFSMARFNLHAVATATAAEVLALELMPQLKDYCFIAGLFHDIGELLLAHTFPREYVVLLTPKPPRGREREEMERTLFGTTHSEVSATAIAHWNLSKIVQLAVLNHETATDVGDGSRLTPGAILRSADRYAVACGYSVSERQHATDSAAEALGPLGIEPEAIRSSFLKQLNMLR